MGTNETGAPGTAGGSTTLTAEIRRVLARVDAHAAHAAQEARAAESGRGTGTGSAPESDDGAGPGPGLGSGGSEDAGHPVQHPAGPAIAPLDALVACFGLSDFERDLVLLTAAYELEATTAARCAAASGDPERAYPTFSLALAALAEPHWSALTPVALCGAGGSWSWTTTRG